MTQCHMQNHNKHITILITTQPLIFIYRLKFSYLLSEKYRYQPTIIQYLHENVILIWLYYKIFKSLILNYELQKLSHNLSYVFLWFYYRTIIYLSFCWNYKFVYSADTPCIAYLYAFTRIQKFLHGVYHMLICPLYY